MLDKEALQITTVKIMLHVPPLWMCQGVDKHLPSP